MVHVKYDSNLFSYKKCFLMKYCMQFLRMVQSQQVVEYVSDSENSIDVDIGPSKNAKTVRREKHNRRK